MNKRLLKRHKRQVARAKDTVRLSEPDVRTPGQVKAAREASRPDTGRRTGDHPQYFSSPAQSHAEAAKEAALQPVGERSVSTTASDPGGMADRHGKGAGGRGSPFEPGKADM
jgi:hypothetical protein